MRRLDLQGKKFGRLTVLEYVGDQKWRCQCDCGNEKIALGGNINSGDTQSCGCLMIEKASGPKPQKRRPQIDITGQRFGFLIALSYQPDTGRWLCRCDCGNEVLRPSGSLRSGATKSCGCRSGMMRMAHQGATPYQAALLSHYHNYKKSAKNRSIPFSLTLDEFEDIVLQPCAYCDTRDSITVVKGRTAFHFSGIDRINNDHSIGYIPGNVESCCGAHNRMKGGMGKAEFLALCQSALAHAHDPLRSHYAAELQ